MNAIIVLSHRVLFSTLALLLVPLVPTLLAIADLEPASFEVAEVHP